MSAVDSFLIALEGECDPRRDPVRGARLDTLLDGMTEEQIEAILVACQRLEVAAACAQIRNFGFKPMPVTESCPSCKQPVMPNADGTLPGHQIAPGPKRAPMCRFRGVVPIGAGT
jgi:hypothetical protein